MKNPQISPVLAIIEPSQEPLTVQTLGTESCFLRTKVFIESQEDEKLWLNSRSSTQRFHFHF